MEELERRFEILLRDEEFTSRLGSFVSSYLQVKRRSDAIMESYCSMMNLPTKSEINGMYKKLHDLEKKVDRLSRERHESECSQHEQRRLVQGNRASHDRLEQAVRGRDCKVRNSVNHGTEG